MNSGNMRPQNTQRTPQRTTQQRTVSQQRSVQGQGSNYRRVTVKNGTSPRRPNKRRKNRKTFLDYYILAVIVAIAVFAILLTVQAKKNKATEASAETDSSIESTVDKSDNSEQTAAVTTEATVEKEEPIPEFKADLTAYEEYMNPQGDKRDAYLILVSPSSTLSESYVPDSLTDLVNTRKDGRATQQMSLYAAKALEALYLDADANGMLNKSTGYVLSVTSAYRSYAKQNSNFNNYVNQEMKANSSLTKAEAEKIVSVYCNPAGASEHQTGLCCDMHNQVSANSDYPEVFANTPEGKWLTENCWKYGFILRYPENKVDITKITYESWHFRYVGRYHAKRITEMNMCLEEYVAYLNNK